MSTTIQKIEIGAHDALNVVNAALPVVEALAPAAGPGVGLGVSLAASLIPLLEQIPVGTVISAEEQAALKARIQKLTDFSGDEWKVKQG